MRKEKKIPLWLRSNVKEFYPAVMDATSNNEARPGLSCLVHQLIVIE